MKNPSKKPCYKCKSIKPATEFGLDKQNKDGRKNICKACYRIFCKEYRARQKKSSYKIGYTNKDPLYEQVIAALPRDGYPSLEEIE